MTASVRDTRAQYIRLPEVLARYGCARATIYAWIAKGEFPPPIRLGRRLVAWRLDQLEAWEATRQVESPQRLRKAFHPDV